MIAFHSPDPNQQHTHLTSPDWLMATLIIQFSHSRTSLSEFFPQLEVLISLLYPWDRLHFPKMATVIAPIHMVSQCDSDPDMPHIQCWAFSLTLTSWTQGDTCDDLRQPNAVWWCCIISGHRPSYCQVLLPYFLGILTLGIHLLCCQEPKEPLRPPNSSVSKEFMMSLWQCIFLKFKTFQAVKLSYWKWSQKKTEYHVVSLIRGI